MFEIRLDGEATNRIAQKRTGEFAKNVPRYFEMAWVAYSPLRRAAAVKSIGLKGCVRT